jgi:hypothetical protein
MTTARGVRQTRGGGPKMRVRVASAVNDGVCLTSRPPGCRGPSRRCSGIGEGPCW